MTFSSYLKAKCLATQINKSNNFGYKHELKDHIILKLGSLGIYIQSTIVCEKCLTNHDFYWGID